MNRFASLLAAVRNFVLPLIALALAAGRSLLEELLDFLNGDVAKAVAQFDRVNGKLDRARMAAVRRANKIDDRIEALLDEVDALDGTYEDTMADVQRAARVQARIAKLLD